jgi:hypothetical protein
MHAVSEVAAAGRLRIRDKLRFLVFGRAYRRRFVARAAEHGIILTPAAPIRLLPYEATAAVLVLVVSTGWLGAQLRETRLRNRSMAVELDALRRPTPAALRQMDSTAPASRFPEVRTVREDRADAVRKEAERMRAGLEQARVGMQDLGQQLAGARGELEAQRSEMAGYRLSESRRLDELRESQESLKAAREEVKRLEAARAEDAGLIASQKLRLVDVNQQLKAQGEMIDRERKLLVADLDIRELMGARSLHIVDVFDVDGKGKTRRPFGRIFYTEGKSLLFYAFDLKIGETFQAWGQRESRDESARSLGIFYVDEPETEPLGSEIRGSQNTGGNQRRLRHRRAAGR